MLASFLETLALIEQGRKRVLGYGGLGRVPPVVAVSGRVDFIDLAGVGLARNTVKDGAGQQQPAEYGESPRDRPSMVLSRGSCGLRPA